jgi:hypothetical protein
MFSASFNPPSITGMMVLGASPIYAGIYQFIIWRRSSPRGVLPVDVRPPKVPIGIFTLKNRAIGPVARFFVEHAREVARPLSRIRIVTTSPIPSERNTL